MKRAYGALVIGIFLLSTTLSTSATVTWGDVNGEYRFTWYTAKNTVKHYDYGLYLPRMNSRYYELSLYEVDRGNDLPSDYDILVGNQSIRVLSFEIDYYPSMTQTAIRESHLAFLPVMINGSSYFEYLFAEKTSLEYLTQATITSTSIANNKATMKGTFSSGSYHYDVTYTWSTTSGLLQEKLVKGTGLQEYRLVVGSQPTFFQPTALFYLIPLFLGIVAMIFSMTRTFKKASTKSLGAFGLEFFIELIITCILVIAFLFGLFFAFGGGTI